MELLAANAVVGTIGYLLFVLSLLWLKVILSAWSIKRFPEQSFVNFWVSLAQERKQRQAFLDRNLPTIE